MLEKSLLAEIRLYKAVENGPAAFRDQKFNIRLLLKITESICQRISRDESILLLFVQMTELAHSILNLLDRRGTFHITWVLLVKGDALAAGFESLKNKRDLLQLHVAQGGLQTLDDIQGQIASMHEESNIIVGRESISEVHDIQPCAAGYVC